MLLEDYLPCGSYENQPVHPKEANFSAFFHEESQRHFFGLLDANGKTLLRSEGYPQSAARETGILSVIKNRANREYYSAKEDNGKYYLSLRAANYREIARSCPVDSEAEALALIPFLTGEKVRTAFSAPTVAPITAPTVADKTAAPRFDDDYLACKEYEGRPNVENGLVKFTHTNGNHYFAWYDDDNKLLMRSEGYQSTASRDNGMTAFTKNRDVEERYSILQKMGRYFVILKSANHQEIARSCPYDTEIAAKALLPSARAEAAKWKVAEALRIAAEDAKLKVATAATALSATVASAITPPKTKSNTDDDYLACRHYDGQGDSDAQGIVRWQYAANNQHYFTWVDNNGRVKMRSEGYASASARDKGVESVVRNRDIKERYEVKQMMGKHFVILKAANHQEIARSCPKDDINAVGAMFPILGLGGAVATAVAATPSVTAPVVDVEDDYLPCREYHGHMTAPHDGFRVFISQRTGKYYFAVVDEDDDISLRSEGYTSAKERDGEMEDVVKNMFLKERYEIKKVGLSHYYILLKNPAGKEIARSCAYDSLNALYAAAPFLDPNKKDAKIGLGAPLALAATAAVAAKAVSLDELKALIEVNPVKLPKPTPKPIPKVEPKVVAAPFVEPIVERRKRNWWWLLLPLLLLLGWWLFGRGCGKAETTAVAVAPVPQPVVAPTPEVKPVPVDTVQKIETVTPTAPVASAPDCNLNWIFFDFDKSNIRPDAQEELVEMSKILKDNKSYIGVLSAHTDIKGTDDYNEDLSSRRAESAKAALIKLGIEDVRIQTEKSGRKDPIAKNTKNDKGRHFNRRVELYIRDKSGKEICRSIPPVIPADLKVK